MCARVRALTATDAHGLTATSNDGLIVVPPLPEPGPFHSKQLPVHVTPNKGLHDGDTVTVTASGFMSGASVAIIECNGSAVISGSEACDLNTSTFLNGRSLTADALGNVTTTYAITQHITTPKDGPLDCATSNVDPDAYNAGVAEDPSRTLPRNCACDTRLGIVDVHELSPPHSPGLSRLDLRSSTACAAVFP